MHGVIPLLVEVAAIFGARTRFNFGIGEGEFWLRAAVDHRCRAEPAVRLNRWNSSGRSANNCSARMPYTSYVM